MAIDRSTITIPPLMSVTATDKIIVPQQVTFNNGVFILNSSLGKPLSKSLYKVWAKENKVYLFERETTTIEKIIDSLASQTTRTFKIGGSDSDFAFVNADGTQIAEKQADRLLLTSIFNQYNNTVDNIDKTLSNYQPYTNSLVSSNFNNYINKTFNAYSLKPEIVTSYLQFAKPTQELTSLVNMNLFLRLKSLFSSREINKDYYNYFTYLLTHWGLFGIDEVSFSSFQEKTRSDTLKQKLKAPLLEQDLSLRNSIKITNTKELSFNTSNVERFEDVFLYDTTSDTSNSNSEKTIALTDKNGEEFFDEDNFQNYLNKVFIFINNQTNEVSAVKNKLFYDIGNVYKKTSFSYQLGNVYDSLGGAQLLTNTWSIDKETRVRNQNPLKKYTLFIYDLFDYVDIPISVKQDGTTTKILELELNSNFRTNSQGDFYVVEIV
jgi:hypothetical protein